MACQIKLYFVKNVRFQTSVQELHLTKMVFAQLVILLNIKPKILIGRAELKSLRTCVTNIEKKMEILT